MAAIATVAVPTSTSSSVTIDVEVTSVLDKLDSFVGTSGSIRSAQDIPKIISLMKETDTTSSTIINRCVILNTLHATKTQSTLSKFMESGGWNVLNTWLSDAKKTQNAPLLLEILQVLQKLPVNITALKQGNMGKIVKQLSKHESNEVKNLASEILAKWMAIFREGQAARGKSSSTSDKLEGGPMADLTSDDATKTKKEKLKKSKKEQRPPAESQPPLGPLVALGKPRDKLTKRPRDLNFSKPIPIPDKKAKLNSPVPNGVIGEDDTPDKDKNQKGLMESNSFMNALSNQAAKWQEKRVKKPKGSKSSPTQTKAPDEVGGPTSNGVKSPSPVTMDTTTPTQINGIEPEPMETDEPMTGKPKKRVSWVSDKDLVTIHYFEMDESERVNVSVSKSFLDAAQHEKQMEKEALSAGKAFDQLVEIIQWYRPKRVLDVIEMVERGKESTQKLVQTEREGTVLAQLFLNKSTVPPTPAEPDSETVDEGTESKPRPIPLFEPGSVSSQSNGIAYNHVPPGPLTSPQQYDNQSYYYNNSREIVQGPGNVPGPPREPMGSGDPSLVYSQPPGGYQYYQNGFRGGHIGPPPRGRGRGKFSRGALGNICKHYVTHGCRMGTSCKFLHVTPEEYAVRMSQERGAEFPTEGRTLEPDHSPSLNQ